MVTKIKNGKVFTNGAFASVDLYISDTKIASVGGEMPFDEEIDAKGCFVSAGFIELHCHGGGGGDFNDMTKEAVVTAVNTHLACGATTIFPTLSATDIPRMEAALDAIHEVMPQLPSIAGVHLEGPYFSPAASGAQIVEAMTGPVKADYERIVGKYEIARWSYAPELDENFEFLEFLNANGVVAAAAHTDATCREMEEAAKRGCKLITHLYSCTSTIKRKGGFRIAGVTEAAYLVDDICVELIADGCHLPPELLRLAYKCKGKERIALITDGIRAAGYKGEEPYIAKQGTGGDCLIEDGVAKLPDRSAFAGSIATSDRLIKTCLAAGIPLESVLTMMTTTPARIMGLKTKGEIGVGYDADIVIFDKDIRIKTVILQGKEQKGGR
ncbi:MAG: amidohydrolase family protein [Clostridia bacterium]|nr:amidohydrolase family protein [Clostridia bacterium]